MKFLFSSVYSKAIDMCLFAAIVSFKIYSYSIYQLVTGRLLGWENKKYFSEKFEIIKLKKKYKNGKILRNSTIALVFEFTK